MIFTERHKDAAKVFEILATNALAEHFKEQLKNDKSIDESKTEALKNTTDVNEGIALITDFVKSIERHQNNVKLLDDIQNGKYRLIFMALAAGMDEAHELIKKNIDKDELERQVREVFDLGED